MINLAQRIAKRLWIGKKNVPSDVPGIAFLSGGQSSWSSKI